ncbi:hypothetical protein L6452_41829 [Arctium lappa]|uniref:Uncharacterized protein n=1 Tax=Arctium lappa TaxID=4217 RepID=A0ACB8XGR6_ARCLA|nr:hypothetical protein L6452_41829 [Arctium lappa]
MNEGWRRKNEKEMVVVDERNPSPTLSKEVGASPPKESVANKSAGIRGLYQGEQPGSTDETKGEAEKDKWKSLMIAEQEAEEAQKKKEASKYRQRYYEIDSSKLKPLPKNFPDLGLSTKELEEAAHLQNILDEDKNLSIKVAKE